MLGDGLQLQQITHSFYLFNLKHDFFADSQLYYLLYEFFQ